MNIGIINSFSHRPHNQHLSFLDKMLGELKYKVFYANCSGGADSCNTLITKKILGNKVLTCFVCKEFGLKSFVKSKVTGLSPNNINKNCDHKDIALSTLYTTTRAETPDEIRSVKTHNEFLKLSESCFSYYNSVKEWIVDNNIDMVLGYNGRMDLMRAARLASIDMGKVFWTVERPWFGKGLLLVPNEGPLGTKSLKVICEEFIDKPLTYEQALKAIEPISKRKLQINVSEFMQFNKGHSLLDWTELNPKGKFKYLFLPSSRMEHISEVDYGKNAWSHPLDAILELIKNEVISSSDLIIRFHPVWDKKIFNTDATSCINYYLDFCKKHNIKYIREFDKVSTSNLISQADIVFLNGGSSFFESSIIGKPIISLSKSFYDCSRYQFDLHDNSQLKNFNLSKIRNNESKKNKIKIALRFLYLFQFRYHQFTDNITHLNSYNPLFKFSETSLDHFNNTIKKGELIPFDDTCSIEAGEENEIINKLLDDIFPWSDAIDNSEDLNSFKLINQNSKIKQLISNYVR